MNDVIRILSVDLSLRNLGMAMLLVYPDGSIEVENLWLIKTENEAGKTVRKSSDDLRRAADSFKAILERAEQADMVAAEVPSGTQSARGAMSNGIALGLLAAISTVRPPLIQVSAAEAKKCVTGRKNATKDEMIAWAMRAYPKAPWLVRKLKGKFEPIADNEHLADAVAIGHAAVKTPLFQTAMALQRAKDASYSNIRSAVSADGRL